MPILDALQLERRIRLYQTIAVLLSLLSIAYMVAVVHTGRSIFTVVLLIGALLHLGWMTVLQKTQFSVQSRVGIMVSANAALFAFALWAGKDRGFHHFYLTLAALPPLIVGRRNRWALGISVLLPILLYLVIEIGGNHLYAPPASMPVLVDLLYWVLFPFRFLFLMIGAYYVATTGEKAQARLNLTVSELRENVRTSRALLAAIPDMIFRVSSDGRFLDYHCQSQSDLFAPPERLVGRKLIEVLPPDAAKALITCVENAVFRGQMSVYSFELRQGTQSRYFDTRIVGTGANDALMVFQDISERVNAEKTILEQQIQVAAASKMAALGEMAGGIAHEINNPLAIISGNVQQLKDMAEANELSAELARKFADKVEHTVMRISKIIRSLRLFARDGQFDPFEQTSVHDIVADTLELCEQRFLSRAIDFRVGNVPKNLYVECRGIQIGQVLLNLLNNAHDAVDTLSEKWIQLSVEELPQHVRISVMDSGKGIPAEIRQRIMEPFFTTKGVGKGTGLGLSISKGIIEAHQGRIFIDESSNHTCFVIELPKLQKTAS